MSTTNILDLSNRIDELEKNSGGGGSADSAKRSDIATEFNTTTAYTAGCYVYHEGKLYQFNADHSAGAWDPTDMVEVNVTDQIVSNASAIAGLTASDVAYDNTDSGLTATDVQGVVDELADDVTSVEDALDGLQEWSEEVDVQVNEGHFYFSRHPIGLKRIRWELSTSTSETTYSNIIPDDYLPLGNTTITGYDSRGGLRSAIMYRSTKNIIVMSSSQAGFNSQQIYT